MAPSQPSVPSSRSNRLDKLVMMTNDSSIVSKRSVERFYFPDEPHFFRYFVQKFQRRSPLINRGYWMRLKAVDVVVRQFLLRRSTRRKAVINLGCGSDVLPWQCNSRYGNRCAGTLFIDIDHGELMRKKLATVLKTPQLCQLLGDDWGACVADQGPILLRSERYCQLGCDLSRLDVVQEALDTIVQLNESDVLFIAEVSITYMDTASADSLIQWASSINTGTSFRDWRCLYILLHSSVEVMRKHYCERADAFTQKAEFCLLEQILPQGAGHPFAQTMLGHFHKLNTPLKSVLWYPTLDSQRSRFQNRGWSHVDARDLWDAWSDENFVNSAERAHLDEVEPFDEWEEFILFARHYSVVHASTTPFRCRTVDSLSQHIGVCREDDQRLKADILRRPGNPLRRRFGDVLSAIDCMGEEYALHLMGLGDQARSDTYDVFGLGTKKNIEQLRLPLEGPTARMCCTLTNIGNFGVLMVGGRGSPSNALADCWLFQSGVECTWQRTWRLPVPLYRHCSVRLGASALVLTMGGKTGPTQISRDSYIFHPRNGWIRCRIEGCPPCPSFGAFAFAFPAPIQQRGVFRGFLAGGIGLDGLVVTQTYVWQLDVNDIAQPSIQFQTIRPSSSSNGDVSIFGAKCIQTETCALVLGGIGSDASVLGQSVRAITTSDHEHYSVSLLRLRSEDGRLPLMIGSSYLPTSTGFHVLGGGATCFSMGTYWETEACSITLPQSLLGPSTLKIPAPQTNMRYLKSQKVISRTSTQLQRSQDTYAKASVTQISRVTLSTEAEFEEIVRGGQPIVIEDVDLGECLQKWSSEYLVRQIGKETTVVVHESHDDTGSLDFNNKNFDYIKEAFGQVMTQIDQGRKIYMRSLSAKRPASEPADLDADYPALSRDFRLPPMLNFVRSRQFSSILRISGSVNMWLHYDVRMSQDSQTEAETMTDLGTVQVMANVYSQVIGQRRMVLFPPSDVGRLSVAPGASSSSLDVFASLEGSTLIGTHPHEAILKPGDVLFLPALWLHAAAAESAMSVAVNTFFRDLDVGYAMGRDVYGNRDLAAYEKGRVDAGRIVRSFQSLPRETRQFYLGRIAEELKGAAEEG